MDKTKVFYTFNLGSIPSRHTNLYNYNMKTNITPIETIHAAAAAFRWPTSIRGIYNGWEKDEFGNFVDTNFPKVGFG